jgi:pre-mRNA-splicing factor 18
MDSLKALVAAKRREVAAVAGSGSNEAATAAAPAAAADASAPPPPPQPQQQKRYVRRGELEEARLKRLREEEEAELRRKRARQQEKAQVAVATATTTAAAATPAEPASAASPQAKQQHQNEQQPPPPNLPQISTRDAFRRLRALREPVTLFGESPTDRVARLLRLERAAALAEDETRGKGQPQNVLLAIKRGQAVPGGGGGEAQQQPEEQQQPPIKKKGEEDEKKKKGGGDATATATADAETADAHPPDPLAAAFAAAARQLAAQRADAALPLEQRLSRQLREWEREWGDELAARRQQQQQPTANAAPPRSGPGGNLAHDEAVYRQTLSYLEPLHDRLARRALDDELLTGLWMIARHARERNYLAANDVYLRLAIGNKAWPIGVTSVGIHERSAREKIAEHTAEGRGGAHIMTDEASRKFLQAVKRLLGVVQRLRPTDPSRAADFNAASGALAGGIVGIKGAAAAAGGGAIVVAGGGAAGGGGGGAPVDERSALRLADARGETKNLAPAPSVVDERDGSVRIPPKWDAILARERAALEQERRWARMAGGDGGGASGK